MRPQLRFFNTSTDCFNRKQISVSFVSKYWHAFCSSSNVALVRPPVVSSEESFLVTGSDMEPVDGLCSAFLHTKETLLKRLFHSSVCQNEKSCQSVWRAQLSSDVGHVLQVRRLHAARAELIHPQGGFVLERGAAGVESVWRVVIQKAAQRGHVDVWETI